MNNKLIVGIISVVVTIVLVGSVLIPVINDSLERETIVTGPDKIALSSDTTWALTTDGKLYGCGDNSYGQQGDGTTTNVTTFTQRLSDETIKKVVCSPRTTWVLTTDGKLYGCGYNDAGQQGDGTTTNVTTFTQRLSEETIKDVWCSESTTWVLTTDGKLYGCGVGSSGQQGSGSNTDVKTFTQRLSDETINNVVCSKYTTWVLTADGKLYGCGYNNAGQQGDGTTTSVRTFTQRLSDESIKDVVCSDNATWALTTDGKLYGCGSNYFAQQGDGTTTNVTTFTQRLSDETIKEVLCSENTTWVLTTDGKLYGCGDNGNGQQGNGTHGIGTNVTTFTQRLSDETIKDVAISSGTTWALTTDGKLYGCGNNYNGQQGIGADGMNTNVDPFTQRLSDETIKEPIVSGSSTWALTTDGKLYGCGNNSGGQQGDGATTNVKLFTLKDGLTSSAVVVKEDSSINDLLKAIPLMVIVSIVIMAITLFLVARKE